jgi:hypothetical protein
MEDPDDFCGGAYQDGSKKAKDKEARLFRAPAT